MPEAFQGIRIAPSILSADFPAGWAPDRRDHGRRRRVIHFDVMDGQSVLPITIGPLVLSGIADQVHDAGGVVDVHLMIEGSGPSVRGLRPGRADPIIFHEEATPHAHRCCHAIRELGCLAGVAINPGTRSKRFPN